MRNDETMWKYGENEATAVATTKNEIEANGMEMGNEWMNGCESEHLQQNIVSCVSTTLRVECENTVFCGERNKSVRV